MNSGTRPGTSVRIRGERWRVAHVEAHPACRVLTLDGIDQANAQERLRVIEPFDRPEPANMRARLCRTRAAVLRAALAGVVHQRPASGLWTAASASIDLLPYQLEPALAVLRGSTRVLLADAVGLGKTIQAALIVAELCARGWADRVVIACPPALRTTWAAALARFGIRADVVDISTLVDVSAILPPGLNPWAAFKCAVVSLDFLKRREVMAALDDVPLDVLIVDEAHHLTPGTERGGAIAALASRSVWCVFASATPHSGDVAAYEFLRSLGHHGDSITIFRRTRADAHVDTPRRTRLVRVQGCQTDIDCMSAVESYVSELWRGRGTTDGSVRLVATVIARRAASTPLALERTLVRRRQLLGTDPVAMQPLLPWDDTDDDDDSGPPSLLCRPGLASQAAEAAVLDRIITLARACGRGPKIARLLRLLGRIHEPAIVFTEYRDSVDAVLAALPQTLRAASVTGALPSGARQDTIDRFNASDLDLLVATDCAGEGLNLHHRCRLVIDLEVPWNPLRLEQRIGRVDRLGQRRRVHAIRFCLAGSIEERVLQCLRTREQRAMIVAVQPARDMQVAEAVFDGVPLPAAPLVGTTPPDGRAHAEVARLERQRSQPAPSFDRQLACRPQARHGQAFIVLHQVSYSNAHGSLLAMHAEATRIEMRPPMARHQWRSLMQRATRSPAVADHIDRRAAAVRDAIERQRQPLCDAVRSRIAAIRRLLNGRRADLQLSLFDKRAEVTAARVEDVSARLDQALANREASVASPLASDRMAVQPIAIWQAGIRR